MFKAAKKRKRAPADRVLGDQHLSSEEEDTTVVIRGKQPVRQHASRIHTLSAGSRDQIAEPSAADEVELNDAPNVLHSRFVSGDRSTEADRRYRTTRIDTVLDAKAESGRTSTDHHDHNNVSSAGDNDDALDGQHSKDRAVYLSKLAEVDVPVTAAQDESVRVKRLRKPRMGRDGRPLRTRARRERRSEDIARDAAVDAAMRAQSDHVARETLNMNAESSSWTDDQMLAEIEQRFADTEKRGHSKNPKVASGTRTGPRLGGSRNARLKTT